MGNRELVLLADDEPLSREFLAEALESLGVEVHAVEDGDAAVQALARKNFDFVFTDFKMPGRDGVAVLVESKLREPDRPVILVTAHGTMGVAVEAMRKGADDILEKPVSIEDLELALMRVRDRKRLLRENRFFRSESIGDELLVFGPAMKQIVELLSRVAPSKATVLIHGESGTGKERVAALVHRRSDRANGPFVKINCTAIPESLMESEFFGHEAGAFTGANKRREGRFELASGGTLFLDEIGEMSTGMQVKLLRVLQEGEFQRVGGNRTIYSDVRIVAATNRNLEQEIKRGNFREDLFYRLNVVPVELPPLRDRKEEILPLARHFLVPGATLSVDAEEVLVQHEWPGNVRELQNLMQRACLLSEESEIDGRMLSSWLPHVEIPRPAVEDPNRNPIEAFIGQRLREVEEALIQATMESCGWNRTRAAELLGISVRTLFNRLKVGAGR
jgi:DNA-binding NtrC family response regulator